MLIKRYELWLYIPSTSSKREKVLYSDWDHRQRHAWFFRKEDADLPEMAVESAASGIVRGGARIHFKPLQRQMAPIAVREFNDPTPN
jgi:hypothetical protein